MSNEIKKGKSERGGAGVKFLAVLLVLFLIGNAAYNYIPTAYEAEDFKQEMQKAVVQTVAMPSIGVTPIEGVKIKLQKAVANDNIPSDVLIEVKPVNNVIQAHVVYTKQVPILPLGIYNYNYHFDHTVTPTGFLFKE